MPRPLHCSRSGYCPHSEPRWDCAAALMAALGFYRRAGRERARERRAPCTLDPAQGRLRGTPACARAPGGAGLVAGRLSALLGIGRGLLVLPVLVRVTDLDMRSVTATSVICTRP
ncbi:hypothetical protein SBBP2_2400005 [Burkholderiales bacterium]|nr:hypothetical protein SBBP2_2400005 [Burkholderiales bacterium]